MSPSIIATNLILASGIVLLAVASAIKIKHFYYGGKSEYFKQFFYSGVALTTISVTALLIAYTQYQVPLEELIMGIEELQDAVNI